MHTEFSVQNLKGNGPVHKVVLPMLFKLSCWVRYRALQGVQKKKGTRSIAAIALACLMVHGTIGTVVQASLLYPSTCTAVVVSLGIFSYIQ